MDLGYLGCYSDVHSVVDARCSGRRTCSVRIPDAGLEATRPCLKELKTYLEANYSCVTGEIACADYLRNKRQKKMSSGDIYE